MPQTPKPSASVETHLHSMGYRKYGRQQYDCWAKPVGRSIFIYEFQRHKLGFYIQGSKEILCWDFIELKDNPDFLEQLKQFEDETFRSSYSNESSRFQFVDLEFYLNYEPQNHDY